MTLESGLFAFLASQPGVTGLVSTRIYPLILPQVPTYPAVTYNRVSGVRMHDLLAASGRDEARISINSWATSYAGVKALSEAIRQALDGFRGALLSNASPPVLITTVGSTTLDNEIDFFEDEAEDGGSGQVGIYRVLQDYIISHTEA